jgi:hypothetical protein
MIMNDTHSSDLRTAVRPAEGSDIVSSARRRLLRRIAASPWLLLGAAAAAHAAKSSAQPAGAKSKCVDLEALPGNEAGMRRSLNFKLESPDSQRHCSLCAFFTATAGGCGTCQILTGGAVSADSVCDSFAAKT